MWKSSVKTNQTDYSLKDDNYFKVLEEKEEPVLPKGNPKTSPETVNPRAPIPQHLMLARTRKSNKPVPKLRPGKGGRGRGWRDITAGDAVNYGVKAWNLAKHLATLINVENKCWDVDGSTGVTVTSTPSVINLSNIAQGSDYVNRQGDSILAQSIEFRCRVVGNPLVNGHNMRVLIVRDKLQRGVDPVLGDVLQGGSEPTVQPYLEPQEGRFDILYDEIVNLNHVEENSGVSTTAYIPQRKVLPSLIRKWNQHIKYQNTTGADGSNWIGGLYLMAVSGDASNGPSLRYTFRLRFTDN